MPICGCMATRHKLIGSCLQCGRIVCEQENPVICPFCSSEVTPPLSYEDCITRGYDESTVRAYRLKDKLLLFDKENTKRTQVHDLQADYYETSTWLSEEEKTSIEAKEKERRELIEKINKPTNMYSLNLDSGEFGKDKLVLDNIHTSTATSKAGEPQQLTEKIAEMSTVLFQDVNLNPKTYQSQSNTLLSKLNHTPTSSSSPKHEKLLHQTQLLNTSASISNLRPASHTISFANTADSGGTEPSEAEKSEEDLAPIRVDLTNKGLAGNKGKVGEIYRELIGNQSKLIASPQKTKRGNAKLKNPSSRIQHYKEDDAFEV